MPNEPVTLSQLENKGQTVKVCGLEVPVREWTHSELNYYEGLENNLKVEIEGMAAKLDASKDELKSYDARRESLELRERKLREAAKKAEVNLDLDDEEGWKAYEALLARREETQEKLRDLHEDRLRQTQKLNQTILDITHEIQEAKRRLMLNICLYHSSASFHAPPDNDKIERYLQTATPTDMENAEKVVREGKAGWGITPPTTETDSSTSQTDGTNTVITPPHSRQESVIDDSGI